MIDHLCLIPPKYFAENKVYTNIGELCLVNKVVFDYIKINGGSVEGSDYDIFAQFISFLKKNTDKSSRAAKYFWHVLDFFWMIKADDIIEEKMSVEELWRYTSEFLEESVNTVCGIIDCFELDALGVAITPKDNDAELPQRIYGTVLERVLCPFGLADNPMNEYEGHSSLSELEKKIFDFCFQRGSGAILLGTLDFEFEKPNIYEANKAYDKIKIGVPLKNKERNILKTQLCRDVFEIFAKKREEIFLILSSASNVKSLYQTEQLLQYIDECNFSHLKLSLLAPDNVAYTFALEQVGKYKNITVDAGICGDDCHCVNEDGILYWGCGKMPSKRASLARTPICVG